MRAAGQTVEGVPAALLARELVDQLVHGHAGPLSDWSALPLLRQIAELLSGRSPSGPDDLTRAFARAALPTHGGRGRR